MKRLFRAKSFVAVAVALGAVVAGSAAHARGEVILSIGLNVPHAYVQPQPVYVQPQPVYVQPRTAYFQPQTVYHSDNYRYERRGPNGDSDRDGVPNRFDPDSRHYDPRAAYRDRDWGDADRDGVPNRYDSDSRHYGQRAAYRDRTWGDADRDGVPNRYDNAPYNAYRR